MARVPSPKSARALSSRSKRNSVFRFALSGPWQVKQVSERMRRMSRLNSTFPLVRSAEDTPLMVTRTASGAHNHLEAGKGICDRRSACRVRMSEGQGPCEKVNLSPNMAWFHKILILTWIRDQRAGDL